MKRIKKSPISMILIICIIISSFSGMITIGAKEGFSKPKLEKSMKKQPKQDIMKVNVDINNKNIKSSSSEIINDNDNILMKKTKIVNEKSETKDVFNITETEFNELIQEGFTIEEILEADEIGNEILVNPKELLSEIKDTSETLKSVEERIKKENKEKKMKEIKVKYDKEYNKLMNMKYKEEDIDTLILFVEAKQIELTEELINDYNKNGINALKNIKQVNVKEETRLKHQLTEEEVVGLTEAYIIALESISKITNKSVKELVQEYQEMKNNN